MLSSRDIRQRKLMPQVKKNTVGVYCILTSEGIPVGLVRAKTKVVALAKFNMVAEEKYPKSNIDSYCFIATRVDFSKQNGVRVFPVGL